ncbi:MAG: hypothetical protein V1926_02240 [Candidatus Peregrinibacteria bacterium]
MTMDSFLNTCVAWWNAWPRLCWSGALALALIVLLKWIWGIESKWKWKPVLGSVLLAVALFSYHAFYNAWWPPTKAPAVAATEPAEAQATDPVAAPATTPVAGAEAAPAKEAPKGPPPKPQNTDVRVEGNVFTFQPPPAGTYWAIKIGGKKGEEVKGNTFTIPLPEKGFSVKCKAYLVSDTGQPSPALEFQVENP